MPNAYAGFATNNNTKIIGSRPVAESCMDSTLKIRNNGLYVPNKKKKVFKENKPYIRRCVKPDTKIKGKTVEAALNKFSTVPGFVYTNKVFKSMGLFLINEKHKIVVSLLNRLPDADPVFVSMLKKKSYSHFTFNIHSEDVKDLISEIDEKVKNFEQWLDHRADELNDMVIKSEKWFKDKLVKESFYDLLGVEYNKPFKKFIYDLYSKKYSIAIEVDGSVHDTPEQRAKDMDKDRLTGAYGLHIVRVKAFDEESYKRAVTKIFGIIRANVRGGSKRYESRLDLPKYGKTILKKSDNT